MIDLSYYGQLSSSHTYILNNSKLYYMMYKDTEHKSFVEVKRDKEFYKASYDFNTGSLDSRIVFDGNIPLIKFNNKHSIPVIYNYNNCDKKGDTFIVNCTYKNRLFELYFDKSKSIVLYEEDGYISVFDSTDTKNKFFELEEQYQFTDNGFFCINKKDNNFSCQSDSAFISYNNLQSNNKTGCLIMEYCPTEIIYNYENRKDILFNVTYDMFGIMSSCKSYNYDNIDLAKYNYINTDGSCTDYVCIHPLLFNPFNYTYIGQDPLLYWVSDKLTDTEDNTLFIRDIYKVEKNKLDDLISEINK